jgi:hypothetical protein
MERDAASSSQASIVLAAALQASRQADPLDAFESNKLGGASRFKMATSREHPFAALHISTMLCVKAAGSGPTRHACSFLASYVLSCMDVCLQITLHCMDNMN